MSAALEAQVMNAVAQYSKLQKWKQWGMHRIRKQGAAILLQGPPGTGKTVIAEYLALKIRKRGLKSMSFGDFGSHVPGENARQIRKFFAEARENGEMSIFLDDCEAVLWDRSRAGGSAMWMLEVIDELLVQIGRYHGLIILATNMPQLLDYAIYRRLIAVITVDRPEMPERLRLWKQKIPIEFPLKMSINEFDRIATLQLTGAEIENAIIDYAS
ncbi:MAG TPA: ATP-binding protein, partial [Candidatus Paceibacterota bacterium]|nr:ATP-binding protein [Candidatus Paceibacterota bacterium]